MEAEAAETCGKARGCRARTGALPRGRGASHVLCGLRVAHGHAASWKTERAS